MNNINNANTINNENNINRTNNINYKIYKLSIKEYLLYGLLFELLAVIIAYFFYDSIYPIIFPNLFIKKFFRFISDYLKFKRDSRIKQEFLDFINSISASLSTGYSLENSISESELTIQNIYGKDSIISNEINIMKRKLLLNIPVEKLFEELAERTDIEEIISFSEILIISKKSGGDIISIIKNTVTAIRNNISVAEEINTSISARKFEQLIMIAMPLLIFVYIDFTQPGFFSPLYHNIVGIFISSICLCIYLFAICLSRKILKIEV